MHKTTRIHIAKTPYDIEPETEGALKQYLAALKAALGADGAKDTRGIGKQCPVFVVSYYTYATCADTLKVY